MNDHKAEKEESNDLKKVNDMRELELIAKYERLSDLVLTRLHGNFECTIPRETLMEKAFNGDKVHGDDYQKDEDLHIKLKIVPGSKLYRTELGPETEIAEITPPIHMVNQGFDYGRLPFTSDMVDYKNEYEHNTAIDFVDRLESLEKGSRDRWVEKNADKFTSIEDAGDYYDKYWYLLTDVDYYKENLIRTSKGNKVQRDQRNAVYGRIVHPDWSESKSNEIFYTKPRVVLTVNDKEVEPLPGKLRKKMILEVTKDQYETTKLAEFTKEHDEAMGRQLLTDKQAGSLIDLISKQVEYTLDIPNDIEVEEFGKFIERVDKDVWASIEFQDDDHTFTLDLQSDRIENESSTYHLHRTSIKAAKRDVENFVKWHEVAIREEESGLEFRNSLYESLSTLEHEYVLINGKAKYGGEWLSKISNSKNGDEVLGKSVEVYRRVDDGYTRVFEIEPKEVLQTSKHQAVKRDVEER